MYIYWFSSESGYTDDNDDNNSNNVGCHSTITRAISPIIAIAGMLVCL